MNGSWFRFWQNATIYFAFYKIIIPTDFDLKIFKIVAANCTCFAGRQNDVKLFHPLSLKQLSNIMMLRKMMNETLIMEMCKIISPYSGASYRALVFFLSCRQMTFSCKCVLYRICETTQNQSVHPNSPQWASFSQGINQSASFRFLPRLSVIFGFRRDCPLSLTFCRDCSTYVCLILFPAETVSVGSRNLAD